MSDERAPDSPWIMLLFGVAVVAVGGLLALFPDDGPSWIAWALLVGGGVSTSVGVVGVGVAMGIARANWAERASGRR